MKLHNFSIVVTILIWATFLIPSFAGEVVLTEVNVLDTGLRPRVSFSTNETISLRISCQILTEVAQVDFKFYIYDPNNVQMFYHDGNSMVGRVGFGGAELRNIPITFYTIPGEYTLKGEVIVPSDGALPNSTETKMVKFSIYSPNVILTYPPNGATDMLANPLILRWVSSGATKYKVYVDDDLSLYKPIWTGETYITEITYPNDPADPVARLASGKIYYWKVDGMDVTDKLIATSLMPFSFSIKDVSIPTSRNVGISLIEYAGLNYDGSIQLRLSITNSGNQAINNLTVNISCIGTGMTVTSVTENIDTIQATEVKVILINGGKPTPKTEAVTVTAILNIYDDNPRDNTLTSILKLKLNELPDDWEIEERLLLLGGVTCRTEQGIIPIFGARVEFNGPVTGNVMTGSGGQYKIDNLSPGEYKLKVTHYAYNDSEIQTVVLDTGGSSTPNIDFILTSKETPKPVTPPGTTQESLPVPKPEHKVVFTTPTVTVPIQEVTVVKKEVPPEKVYTDDEAWEIVKGMVADKNLLTELEGYKLFAFTVLPTGNVSELVESLKSGKTKITGMKIEEQK